MKKIKKQLLLLIVLLVFALSGCEAQDLLLTENTNSGSNRAAADTMTESRITEQVPTAASALAVPEFSGEPYVVIHDNQPDFTEEEKTTESYEHYSDLDSLGRCGVAEANIGQDLMPTEKRGAIGQVKPTGWHTVKYDQVDGKYLYNRCHLIGYQLTGENANEKNLITGTRYLNVEGMLPFENMVADYIKETGNHVLYRVTPIFTGENLVADGVEMEALSMEDNGEVGGSAGVILAVFAIVAGIIAIVTRKGEGKGPFVAGGFYLVGGIIGLAMAGSYADLKIWGVACIIFALVFIIGTILEKKRR